MKIAILTCGRSDYSIYFPLLKKLKKNKAFKLDLIVFGSHPYEEFGNTIDLIKKDGFNPEYVISALVMGADEKSVAESMALTTFKFAEVFDKEKYDLIFALGDRYEMLAAVSASVPFNIPVAHLHGGEKTLGAIDEKFRHAITVMSTYHFASTENHAIKIHNLVGDKKNINNVGALALDNIFDLKLKTKNELLKELNIDFNTLTLLATLHPETVNAGINQKITQEFIKSIKKLGMQTIITLPNNDTNNKFIRGALVDFCKKSKKVFAFDALGPHLYYSCMKYCYAIAGNSSSGIIEAATFRKYVVNIGDRQKGRERGNNIIDVPPDSNKITQAVQSIAGLPELNGSNIYGCGKTADMIIGLLKRISERVL